MDLSKQQVAWIASLAFTIVSIVFMASLTFYSMSTLIFGSNSFNFFDITFGAKTTVLGTDVELLALSYINLGTFILVIFGLLIALMKVMSKDFRRTRIVSYLGFLFLFAASLLIIFSSSFIVYADPDYNFEFVSQSGVIVTFITTLVASFGCLVSEVYNK